MTQYYLNLRLTLLKRKLTSHGLNWKLAAFAAFALVILASVYLPEKTEHAPEIIAALTFYLFSQNLNSEKNRFLELHFGKLKMKWFNVLELTLMALPGMFITAYQGSLAFSGIQLIGAVILGLSDFKLPQFKSLATPYFKNPFEFIIGFRKAFGTFFIVLAAMLFGAFNENANLSFFGLVMICLLHIGYYQRQEAAQWVIIFKGKSADFLKLKSKQALVYHNLTLLPFAIAQAALFPETTVWIFGLFLLSNVYLIASILMKYSAFPNEVQISDAIIFAASFVIPPLLFISLPYFYSKAKKHLSPYL